MKQSLWDYRIPTFFAFFLLIAGIGATTFLTTLGVQLFGHAAPSENPENVRITNSTDTSFTVTYKTEASVIGTISVSVGTTDVTKQLFFDDRDQLSGIPVPHVLHSITARNLKPNSTYSFTITSGKTSYTPHQSDKEFTVTTGPVIQNKPSLELPLAGEVVSPDGNQLDEALVYVTSIHGQTLSTMAKTGGSYIIPLNTMRTNNLSSVFLFTKNTVLQVLIVGKNEQSHVSILADKRNPVPSITLGNNYDFTIDTTPLASNSALPAEFSAFSSDTTTVATPQIITPQKDQKFTDPQPILKGKALPKTTVQITIHSGNDIQTTLTTDANGNWSFRPATPLAPGLHTITIVTKDASGILKTIQESFTIFQSGVQVAEAATPSATPTIPPATPSPTASPTPSTVLTGSPSPTPLLSPTLTPSPTATPSPTLTLSPTVALTPTITPKPLPPTGNNSVVTISITALVTTMAGIVLFIFSKGVTL